MTDMELHNLERPDTLAIPGVLRYDGEYDGPGYYHAFWPRVGYPQILDAVYGEGEFIPGIYGLGCEICGLTRGGREATGKPTDHEDGNPHQNSAHGWPMTVLLHDLNPVTKAGSVMVTCPHCASFDVFMTIAPGGLGTGPGGRWRMGDPGGRDYTGCNNCGRNSLTPHQPLY